MRRRLEAFLAERRAFLLLLGAAAAARLLLLETSQAHAGNDEALLGLMARHILAGKALPVYAYGQVHNGGAAIEAYLAAGSFFLFGQGVFQLKLAAALLSLAAMTLVYAAGARRAGNRAGLLAALLFALMPTLLRWSLQVRGYGPHLVLIPALLLAFFELERRGRESPAWAYALFGGAAGLGLWSMELILPFVAAALAWLAWKRPDALSPKKALWAPALFALGYSPALAFNLTHRFANWSFIFGSRLGEQSGLARLLEPRLLASAVLRELPRFFGQDTLYLYYPAASAAGVLFYLFFAAATAAEARREPALLLALAGCLIPYLSFQIRSPGYLLGACPVLALLGGFWLDRLLGSGRSGRLAAAALLALLASGWALETAAFAGSDDFEALAFSSDGRFIRSRRYPGKDLAAAVELLKARGVSRLWAAPSFEFPLIFETSEGVVASADAPFAPQDHPVFPAYDAAVASSPPVYLVEEDSPLKARAEAWFRGRGGLRETRLGTLTLLEGTVRGSRP